MEYNFEAKERLRAGFIGAGGHAYRNIYPAFQYAPVELVALADHHPEKATGYARLFGAERWYTDHRDLFDQEKLDAVFISVGFDAQGCPRYPQLAIEAMRAGCHVWIEKPPAATTAEIEGMQRVSAETGKHVAVGYKKMFFPAYAKVKQILATPEFGRRPRPTCATGSPCPLPTGATSSAPGPGSWTSATRAQPCTTSWGRWRS